MPFVAKVSVVLLILRSVGETGNALVDATSQRLGSLHVSLYKFSIKFHSVYEFSIERLRLPRLFVVACITSPIFRR